MLALLSLAARPTGSTSRAPLAIRSLSLRSTACGTSSSLTTNADLHWAVIHGMTLSFTRRSFATAAAEINLEPTASSSPREAPSRRKPTFSGDGASRPRFGMKDKSDGRGQRYDPTRVPPPRSQRTGTGIGGVGASGRGRWGAGSDGDAVAAGSAPFRYNQGRLPFKPTSVERRGENAPRSTGRSGAPATLRYPNAASAVNSARSQEAGMVSGTFTSLPAGASMPPVVPFGRVASESVAPSDPSVSPRRLKRDVGTGEVLSEVVAGERLAKVIARAGMASRREAERMIEEGKVKVNGKVVTAAGTHVLPGDTVSVDGLPLASQRRARLFLIHKLRNEVVSRFDPEGRMTVFERFTVMGLPANLITVGRLDYSSEGLLLATTDGSIAQFLERPKSLAQTSSILAASGQRVLDDRVSGLDIEKGVSRVYKVKVYGRHLHRALDAMRAGAVIDGVTYAPAFVSIISEQTKALGGGKGAYASNSGGSSKGRGGGGGGSVDEWVDDNPDEEVPHLPSEEEHNHHHHHDAASGAHTQTRARTPAHRSGSNSSSTSGGGSHSGDASGAALEPTVAWLQITLYEGKNREIRRILEHFGLVVNRLLRVSYGPFRLATISRGSALEITIPKWLMRYARAYADANAGGGKVLPPQKSHQRAYLTHASFNAAAPATRGTSSALRAVEASIAEASIASN